MSNKLSACRGPETKHCRTHNGAASTFAVRAQEVKPNFDPVFLQTSD